jgi:hypothetical protein
MKITYYVRYVNLSMSHNIPAWNLSPVYQSNFKEIVHETNTARVSNLLTIASSYTVLELSGEISSVNLQIGVTATRVRFLATQLSKINTFVPETPG